MIASLRRKVPFLLMMALTIAMIVVVSLQTLARYHELRSGWSWDLAYYNQWFWALTHGHDISVRPLGPWTQEGPSVWTMNYLAPIRLLIVPIYAVFPDPRTLLIVQVVFFAMIIPATFGLVRFETESSWVALSASWLAMLTPLAWPLMLNDFRELQMAPAFVIWAMHGVRARNLRLTILGVAGMLACRQEFSFVVASLAMLPPRDPEDFAHRSRWARGLWLAGLGWLMLGFIVYARWKVNSYAFEIFLEEMAGKKFPLRLTIPSAIEILVLGLGSWAVLACLAPRAGVLVLPWVMSVAAGRWAMHQIASEQWHHVRYTAPLVGVGIAAGAIGYARLASWLLPRRRGPALMAMAWTLATAGMLLADWRMHAQMEQIPRPISSSEARALHVWMDRVEPDDGVLAHYEVTAPLSSRRSLYSYVMDQNLPRGYPNLAPEIRWVFARKGDIPAETLIAQGFRRVHDGPHILVFHRDDRPETALTPAPATSTPVMTPGGSNSWSETLYLAVGNAVIVATNLAWAGLLLAPGLAVLVILARRGDSGREWAERPEPTRREVAIAHLLESLTMAKTLGLLAAGVLVVSGLAIASWLPVHLGSAVFSLAIIGPTALAWPWQRGMNRNAIAARDSGT